MMAGEKKEKKENKEKKEKKEKKQSTISLKKIARLWSWDARC